MAIEELRFLIAEDEDFQRKTLVRMLTGLGAKFISTATDGKSALELFTSQVPPVDIIISDLEMAGMDGMEFMRHLAQANIPVSVVIWSALDKALIASVET